MLKTVGNPSVRTGDQTINDGNLVIGTSGNGVDFTATTSGTGTMTSELFDDYEEGTFVPAVAFGGNSVGLTYTTRNAQYTKIGDVVYFRIGIQLSNKGSSTGNMTVTGLPFTSKSGSYVNWVVNPGLRDFVGLTGAATASVGSNSTSVSMQQMTATGVSSLTDANVANASYFFVTGFYQV